MHHSPRTSAGTTLIELLTVVSLLIVLAAVAIPAFGNLTDGLRMRSARAALNTAFNHARIAAVHQGGQVVACPSADRHTCSLSAHWHAGWLVFADDNRNREHEPDERIIAAADALPPGLTVDGSAGRPRVAYQADGSAQGANLTVTFCDRRGAAAATALIVNIYGRVRTGPPGAQATDRCLAAQR